MIKSPRRIDEQWNPTHGEHQLASGLGEQEIGKFLDALAALVRPVETHFLWRRQFRNSGDEMVLESAFNGQAKAIVTFNARDFGRAAPGLEIGCRFFGR